MSVSHGTVLVASALVSSPLLWMVQDGSLSPEVALQRWAICVAVCWTALTVVKTFAFPDPVPALAEHAAVQPEPAEVPAETA